MTNYVKTYRAPDPRDGYGDHIDGNPRSDIQKVYLFSREIPVEKLRSELEDLMGGVRPDIGIGAYAKSPMLYLFPVEIPSNMPQEIVDSIKQDNFTTNAVFIRAATNLFVEYSAKKIASEMLLSSFRKLTNKHPDKIAWRFKEAESMQTSKIIEANDPELLKLEFRAF